MRDKWLSDVMEMEVYNSDVPIGDFCYTKVSTSDSARMCKLCSDGFNVVETNIQLTKKRERYSTTKDITRLAKQQDEIYVFEIAKDSFTHSRFYRDIYMPEGKATKVKRKWVLNYFRGLRGDYMNVAIDDSVPIGFLLGIKKDGEFIIDLIAVDKDFRGRGVGTELIKRAENDNDVRQIRVGTQLTNIPSLSLYTGLGFNISDSNYVLHWWKN